MLSKMSVIISITIALTINVGSIVWFAASSSAKIVENEVDIKELQQKLDSKDGIYITRENLEDILSGPREQISSLKEQVTDVKAETSQVNKKLDILLNR